MKFFVIELVVKVWPIGNFPKFPGTVCSFVAAFIGYIINVNFGSDITLLIGVLTGIIGLYCSRIYILKNLKKDPKEVVIDEFSGQMIAIAAAGTSPLLNFIAFILFRFFDIIKPGIISKAENLEGGLGIMADDWISGIISAFILIILSFSEFTQYSWFLL